MKILHLDQNHPLLLEQLAAAGFENAEDYTSPYESIEQVVEHYHGIVIRSRFDIDAAFMDKAINLKFIARVGAGLESIDEAYAAKKGITLISSPEGNRNAVGEHTLGMLLSLFNKLNKADREVKAGHWLREDNRGIEVEGKTVGIIGYGNMGKAFAKKLRGFDCTVLCYDIKEGVGDENAQQVDLETFRKKVDVVSLHTPWTPLTNKMIDARFIAEFEQPFWFLNTARGRSVVTKDLVSALQSGKILGAGLDVLEYEKLSFETLFSNFSHPDPLEGLKKSSVEGLRQAQPDSEETIFEELIAMDNVLLTPHIAGWTVESKVKLAQVIVDKIKNQFSINKSSPPLEGSGEE